MSNYARAYLLSVRDILYVRMYYPNCFQTVYMKRYLLPFVATLLSSMAYAQTPIFTGLSHPNVVTALYSDGADLYVGSRTDTADDRLISYDGQSFHSTGYNESGYEIESIGSTNFYIPPQTIAPGLIVADLGTGSWLAGSVYSYDYSGFTYRFGYVYNRNVWTSFLRDGNNTYVGGTFTSINDGQQQFATDGLTAISISGAVSAVSLPSSSGPPPYVYSSLEYSGQYYIGSNKGLLKHNTQTNQFVATGVEQELRALEEYNGVMYGAFFSQIYSWNGSGSEVLVTNLAGNTVNCVKHYDGKLFFGGDELTMFDGSTWSTIATFGTGGIEAMEVYDGKLYLGGDFSGVNGSPIAYLMTMDFGTVTEISELGEILNPHMLNPSDGLHLQSDRVLDVTVSDINGRLVASHQGVSVVNERYRSGMYIVTLTDGAHVVTKRLVVTQ